MKITIMMAAYNTAPYVEDAITSLLRQGGSLEVEVVVVNDGSTDGTQDILREMASRDEGVRLVDTPNQGVARARNEALRALGNTDFVSFLDSDDLSPAGHFDFATDMLAAEPDLDLVYCSARLFEKTGEDRFAPAPGSRTTDIRGVHLGSGVYRKALIDRVGEFDTSLSQAEDLDFMLRMFEMSPRHIATDRIGLYYRRHGKNMTLDRETGRRDYAKALMRSIQRRRAANLPPMPPGLFDWTRMAETAGW